MIATAAAFVACRAMGVVSLVPAAVVFATVFAAALRPLPSMRVIAAGLDARYPTGDVLLSAWLTDPTDAWSSALRTMAVARIAGLAPTGRPAWFSGRQRFCVIAGAIAAGFMTQLASPMTTPRTATTARPFIPPDAAVQVAAEIGHRSDTGQSNAGLPAAVDPVTDDAGDGTHRARPAGDDAHGGGRADVADSNRSALSDHGNPAKPTGNGPFGAGRAGGVGPGPAAGGSVAADPAALAARPPVEGSASSDPAAAARTSAVPVPDAYRGLVRAFFDR